MNKTLYKEIMTRSRLRNKSLKGRSEENKKKYSKQCNYCVSLLRKSKSDYFGNLNFGKLFSPFYRINKINKQNDINR